MAVAETFVVGKKYSMTYSVCSKKFPRRKLISKKFEKIKDIVRRGLPANKSAVLPFWNSNSGRIPPTEPEKLIFDGVSPVSPISELWCERIIFVHTIRGSFKGAPRKIGSALVAQQQCSKFLEKENLAKRFFPSSTTTDAVAGLCRGKVDAVLCSKELATARSLKILKKDCANPFNMTTFAEFVRRGQAKGNVYLVAIEMPRLDMGRTTQVHEEIMEEIFGDVANFSSMPKIVFAMQTREDRYGLLLEFPNFPGEGSPLPPFDAEADVRVVDRVGRLLRDFSSRACDYMAKTFRGYTWPEFAGYGLHEAYFCACPALDIFVQGYDPIIVEEIALLSLEKHVDLFAHNVKHPDPAACGLLSQLFKRVQKGKRIQDFVKFAPLANSVSS